MATIESVLTVVMTLAGIALVVFNKSAAIESMRGWRAFKRDRSDVAEIPKNFMYWWNRGIFLLVGLCFVGAGIYKLVSGK